jgi:hypothetical protein
MRSVRCFLDLPSKTFVQHLAKVIIMLVKPYQDLGESVSSAFTAQEEE